MRDELILQLSKRLFAIGANDGFSKPIIRSNQHQTEIYIVKDHAIQLEIDWTENNLFMYVVYLKNRQIPNKNIVYTYPDGQWCRKFLEEIYNKKRPHVKDVKARYSQAYLFDCLSFYEKLIDENPVVLKGSATSGGFAEHR